MSESSDDSHDQIWTSVGALPVRLESTADKQTIFQDRANLYMQFFVMSEKIPVETAARL